MEHWRIIDKEHRGAWRQLWSIATLSTANSAWTDLIWNPGIRAEGLRLTAWTIMICAPESRQDLF